MQTSLPRVYCRPCHVKWFTSCVLPATPCKLVFPVFAAHQTFKLLYYIGIFLIFRKPANTFLNRGHIIHAVILVLFIIILYFIFTLLYIEQAEYTYVPM